ncbi:MAG: hypothetical protein ABI575_01295 [Oxalobacteraceae bacterium]
MPSIGIDAVAGVTAMDTKVSAVTVKVPEPDLPPKSAVMTEVPLATPVAAPDVLFTVATLVLPEIQLEDAVTLRVDPSLNVAVAANGWMPSIGIDAVAGVTEMDTNVGAVTVKVPELDLPPKTAVMTEVPLVTPAAKPEVLITDATLGVPEVQLEDAVTSLVVPSLYVAVAVNA